MGSRRANWIREFLLFAGISPTRIRTITYGKERPLDRGASPISWAKNNRVEILFEDCYLP